MNKELKITPPEGYEIDKEKSTLEHIVFKPVDKKAKTWEEIQELNFENRKKQFFVGSTGEIEYYLLKGFTSATDATTNHVNTHRQAEKIRALCQLYIIADYYNDGWVANCKDRSLKYAPYWDNKSNNLFVATYYVLTGTTPTFKSEELLLEAYESNKEIFETALKP